MIKMAKTKGTTNNPNGRPTKYDGPTEMVSKRLPTSLMDKVRASRANATQFIIDAITEKLEKAH
jgi:hypothetical protein